MPAAAKRNKADIEKRRAQKTQDKNTVGKISQVLSVFFYFIWILIGLLVLVFIYANLRQGAFSGLFSPRPLQQQTQVQPPAETDLPGIGKVNIQCVQDSLSQETIQKIVETGDASKLTDEEKAKLEPCIVEKEEASPSASPTPNK